MRAKMLLCALIAILFCSYALAGPGPIPGTENIPKLMAESALVCKGAVTDADEVKPSAVSSTSHLTVIATIHIDRCFKGDAPAGDSLPVFINVILPASGSPFVVIPKGEYRLFFLKLEAEKYVLADNWFGELPISRIVGPIPVGDADPMHRLELDLKAGLHDSKPELVLDSIRMLGNMRHLQSTAELTALLDSPDLLVRTYVYEALLRLHDYTVLPAVANWLEAQPQSPHELFLPRDALFEMQYRLARELSQTSDPIALPELLRLLLLPDPIIRQEVLQSVRAIHSPRSADALLHMLDDSNPDNGFGAMQGLLEISDNKDFDWVPSLPVFRANQKYYAAKCREWWELEKKKAQ